MTSSSGGTPVEIASALARFKRAADSVQLGATMDWCEYAPQDRVFLTADQKLRDAAILAGFDAKQL